MSKAIADFMQEIETAKWLEWPAGEWMDEPNIQAFEHKGFRCVILRNRMGNLCGYVGVPPQHPFFGQNYNTPFEYDDEGESPFFTDPEVAAVFERLKKAAEEEVALRRGAVAPVVPDERINEMIVHGGLTYAGDSVPLHDPDGWWYFGFDCAHFRDFVPGRHAILEKMDGPRPLDPNEIYRNFAYVRGEIEDLIEQFIRIGPGSE